MPSPRITAVADDATGALEVGCRLNSNGLPSEVWFGAAPAGRSRSIVVNTQSRHCAPREARSRVREVLSNVQQPGWIFKKTDSTLRGNIAAEIAGVFDSGACRSVVYVPAYPALGRTVVEGRLLIDGIPVEETAFARDPLFPVRSGLLPQLFADSDAEVVSVRGPAELAQSVVAGSGSRIVICDATTDEEIDAAARTVANADGNVAAAGAAPFAGALARHIGQGPPGGLPSPSARSGLIVCGSLHPASLRQVEFAAAQGILAATSSNDVLPVISSRKWAVLKPPDPGEIAPRECTELLADATCQALAHTPIEALVLFGGETAYAILQRLNVDCLEPQYEILTGVSMSLVTGPRKLLLLAKAGGFGTPTLIPELLRRLDPAALGRGGPAFVP